MKHLLILFLLILTGCASTSGHYTVYIDPSFSKQHVNQIREGVLEWSRIPIKHPPTFDFVFNRPVSPFTLPQYNSIYVYPGVPIVNELGWTNWYKPNNMAWVMLVPYMPDDWFKEVVMHEFGHAFGLDHLSIGTIMNFSVGGMSNNITKTDIKALCKEHPDWCK